MHRLEPSVDAMALLGRPDPGELFLHSRLWEAQYRPAGAVRRSTTTAGRRAVREDFPDPSHDRPPARLVQHRCQSNDYTSPLRRGESLDISPEDAASMDLAEGERVRITSRRGSIEAPVRLEPSLRPA